MSSRAGDADTPRGHAQAGNLGSQRFYVELGAWMASLRERRGMSQEALGVQLGRDQSFVSRTEGGLRRATVRDLVAWLEALGEGYEQVGAALQALVEDRPGSLWRDDDGS